MPTLRVNRELCTDCGICEELLPKFLSVHKGNLYISWAKMRDSVLVQESVKSVTAKCKEGAISLDLA